LLQAGYKVKIRDMDTLMTKYLTLRTVFERATVLSLRLEREFRDSQDLLAEESVQPFNDAYLAIFTLQAEATDEGMLKLRIVSTTVLGIQRYTIKRLLWQNVYMSPGGDGLMMNLLRAHYRHRHRKMTEAFAMLGGPDLRRWTEKFSNGAGDLDDPPEFLINDPDLEQLNRIAGTLSETGEEDECQE
jgi:hypothetical protein